MEISNPKELILLLQTLEQQQKSLSVSWNAGGDETLVMFSIGGEEVRHSNDPNLDLLLDNLRDYLIQQRDLPNAGEFYNRGGGQFYIDAKGKVCLRFQELAYHESSERQISPQHIAKVEGLILKMVKVNWETDVEKKNVMESPYAFDVRLTFLDNRINVSVSISQQAQRRDKLEVAFQKALKQVLDENLSADFRKEMAGAVFFFEGIWKKKEMKVGFRTAYHIFIDKDNPSKELILLYHSNH